MLVYPTAPGVGRGGALVDCDEVADEPLEPRPEYRVRGRACLVGGIGTDFGFL